MPWASLCRGVPVADGKPTLNLRSSHFKTKQNKTKHQVRSTEAMETPEGEFSSLGHTLPLSRLPNVSRQMPM